MSHKSIGQLGAKIASLHLIRKNYRPITQNFFSRFGEIDLIFFDYPKREIALIEVKTRLIKSDEQPGESFTYLKYSRILKTAHAFFLQNPHLKHWPWRIDLIAIKLRADLKKYQLSHLENLSYV